MIFWVADIGGTNCRLAEFECADSKSLNSSAPDSGFQLTTQSHLNLRREYNTQTASIDNAEKLFQNFQDNFGPKTEEVVGLGIAVAGPVNNNRVKLTNGSLSFDGKQVAADFGFAHVLILNDFLAQAYACLEDLDTECINEKTKPTRAVRAILGVGTGLGCATLVPYGQNDWLALPSEAGHIQCPFEKEERTYADWLKSKLKKNVIEAEDVLSGRGLQNLHTFMTGKVEEPKQVLAATGESSTQYWWSGFYGRFCRILALTVLPLGGLWISGGISIKNPKLVRSEAFANEFNLSDTVLKNTSIPLFLFKNEQVGLYGCAAALKIQICQES